MAGKITGAVVAVDAAGNLVTDITRQQLEGVPTDHQVSIICEEHQTVGLFTPDHQEPEMTLLAVVNSQGQLQLVMVGESAQAFLGIRVGAPVLVKW